MTHAGQGCEAEARRDGGRAAGGPRCGPGPRRPLRLPLQHLRAEAAPEPAARGAQPALPRPGGQHPPAPPGPRTGGDPGAGAPRPPPGRPRAPGRPRRRLSGPQGRPVPGARGRAAALRLGRFALRLPLGRAGGRRDTRRHPGPPRAAPGRRAARRPAAPAPLLRPPGAARLHRLAAGGQPGGHLRGHRHLHVRLRRLVPRQPGRLQSLLRGGRGGPGRGSPGHGRLGLPDGRAGGHPRPLRGPRFNLFWTRAGHRAARVPPARSVHRDDAPCVAPAQRAAPLRSRGCDPASSRGAGTPGCSPAMLGRGWGLLCVVTGSLRGAGLLHAVLGCSARF